MYSNLCWIERLISQGSPSTYAVGRCTLQNQTDYQDACGALAYVKKNASNKFVTYAAGAYCGGIGSKHDTNMLKLALHLKLVEWQKGHGRDCNGQREVKLIDIAWVKVFKNADLTDEMCGARLGMSRQSYAKTWRKYVDDLELILTTLLAEADGLAKDYRKMHNEVAQGA